MNWISEELEEKEFWNSLGKNEGYIDRDCPKCGRHRVEHWSKGKSICEKCYWCIEEKRYMVEMFV